MAETVYKKPHSEDVVFTQEGLNKFIEQIRQNPEMVYKVRAATDKEIEKHNYYLDENGEQQKKTLEEGYIPGKGITIIQANGDKFSVAVGSDVKAPNFETEVKNNILFNNGTVTFIVDESYINIPVKGIVDTIDEDNDEIPNSFAVKDYVNESFEDFRDELDGILNGVAQTLTGYGFIPGYYASENKILEALEIDSLNTYLQQLNISTEEGVYETTDQGNKVILNNDNSIAQPNQLIILINNKKNELENNTILLQYNTLLNRKDMIEQQLTELENNKKILESEKIAKESTIVTLQGQIDIKVAQQGTLQTQINNLLSSLSLDINLGESELSTQITIQNAKLLTLNLFQLEQDITIENVDKKMLEYQSNPESEEYIALMRWIQLYGVVQKRNEISNLEELIIQDNYQKSILTDQYNDIKANLDIIKSDSDTYALQKESIEKEIELIKEQATAINLLLTETIPQVYSLINVGADRTWTVIKTQSTSNHEIASIKAEKVYGAVYNDYAEYRVTTEINPGHVVVENGDGTLSLSNRRLQLGGNIVSDTFGFAIGKTSNAQTPLAVCGRVLAYPYEELALFTPGAAVCSGPNGTISLMTREEIREWPDAIIGYVSEIPTYETWGTDNIKVDGRLWIKVV